MAGLISAALPIRQDEDPAVSIRQRVNALLDDIEMGGQDVLVAVYQPKKGEARTKGGIILTEQTIDEYRWQGITGLVLKLGPHAYKTEKTVDWFQDADGNPNPPKVGDWVMFDVKDTHSFLLGEQPCRFVPCQYLLARVARPDMVA